MDADGAHPGWPARPGPLEVRAGVVELRPVRWRDGAAWRRLRVRDEGYLRPWEPGGAGAWAPRHTRTTWWSQCSSLRASARRGAAFPFAVTVDGRFVGQVTVGGVVRGSLRSAWVGYWVESAVAGGGVATAAAALAVDHVVRRGGLHRVEATVQPQNAASLRVLAKLGFREEGLFRRYLEVDGRWRDHRCLAITADELGDGLAVRLVSAGSARFPRGSR